MTVYISPSIGVWLLVRKRVTVSAKNVVNVVKYQATQILSNLSIKSRDVLWTVVRYSTNQSRARSKDSERRLVLQRAQRNVDEKKVKHPKLQKWLTVDSVVTQTSVNVNVNVIPSPTLLLPDEKWYSDCAVPEKILRKILVYFVCHLERDSSS